MASNDTPTQKGNFSKVRLAVSRAYIMPRSRRPMMMAGGVACLAILAFTLVDATLLDNTVLSSGDLSANHAITGSNCRSCHEDAGKASNRKCSSCHEKSGDARGVYSMPAHYLYRSEDAGRVDRAVREHGMEQECSTCHREHQGRMALITDVSDRQCVACHDYGSFNSGHPEFAFAQKKTPDDSSLIFTHVRHMKFVSEKLAKSGITYLEQSCLYCHNPREDGKSFEPLDFDRQCGDCHLPVTSETASLPVLDPANPMSPGVETLAMIQARRGPGTRWAFYTNPNEFTVSGGGRVKKSPVYHADPWVLENLKLIRRMLYADPGLSELLASIGSTSQPRTREQYLEAIATLQAHVDELRSRPEQEVQDDVALLDDYLKQLRAKIVRMSVTLTPGAFDLAMSPENQNITPAQKGAFEDLAFKLTKPCLVCHVVDKAAIQAVQKDQRVLRRAEFSHRAHIVDRRCLECHTGIPVTKEMAGGKPLGPLADRAAIQNIPGRENCIACHTSSKASNTCVSCHSFHPNKSNRSNLKLFVDTK